VLQAASTASDSNPRPVGDSSSAQRDTVSVVIPAYNAALFVTRAIESAEAQTAPPQEIIVVDDGSTDDTAATLAAYGSRIRVVTQANCGLPGGARNAGAAVATATWLAFLDADDNWLPEKLERQLQIGRDPAIALIYTDRFNIGAPADLPVRQGEVHEMYSGDIFTDLLVLGNRITASSVMVRRDVFNALGGFAEHLRAAEDWDLWIRVAERHAVGFVDEPLVNYIFHGGMFTGDPERMRVARGQVMQRALATARGTALPEPVRRRIQSCVARTNAWDASRKRAHRIAWSEYAAALRARPWDASLYLDVFRYVFRRH
jgi:glycosyltransferase involved in cell wall biosynthesis